MYSSDLVFVQGRNPHELRAFLADEERRNALVVMSPPAMVRPGVWEAEVIQLRRMRPAWVTPAAVVAGSAVAFASVGALAWWLVTAAVSMLAGVGVTSLAGFGALLALAWLLGRRGGGRGGACETTVIVRHRH